MHQREGVAISNGRITSADANTVAFCWKDYRIKNKGRQKVMRLTTSEFIRCFLIHVLPPSRQIALQSPAGQWTGSTASDTTACWQVHGAKSTLQGCAYCSGRKLPNRRAKKTAEIIPLTLREPCPDCGGQMRIIETFKRGQRPQTRAPPRKATA